MAGNEYHQVRPHTAQNAKKIAAGSPLAVLGIFIETLRERFNAQSNLGIEWREDVQTTDILIEAGYSVETESRDPGRALYVNRLSTTPQQIAVGDLVGVHLPSSMEGFTCMMGLGMTVDCVSNDAGDSAILADIVQHFFIASSKIFESMYGFHDFGLAQAGQTQPFEHDQEKWSTTVSLSVQFQARWSTVKIRPLLQGVSVRVADAPEACSFENTAMTSLQRSCDTVEQIGNRCGGLVTIDQISPALIDPAPDLPGLRTLGRGHFQAMPGDTAIAVIAYDTPQPVSIASAGSELRGAAIDHSHDVKESGGAHLTVGSIPDGTTVVRAGSELVGVLVPVVTGDSVLLPKTAAAPLSGHRVVLAVSATDVDVCDARSLSHMSRGIGITTGAAAAAAPVTVMVTGEMVEPSWTFTAGAPVFCGNDGILTQVDDPAWAWIRIVAVAESATKIMISFREPIAR